MRHIVYCWELGEGLGHIMALAKIAREMTRQGNRVTCVVKDLSHAARMLGPLGVGWIAAPRMWSGNRLTSVINHADILYNTGYSSVENVQALLVAWRTLFSALRPDRVVCDYAPTARLAAKSLGLDVVCIDSGFSMPPLSELLSDPLPPIRPASTRQQLIISEKRTLSVINQALVSISADPLPSFSSLFRENAWYRNWCDFNHFIPHSPERHLGQIFGESGGVKPVWSKGKGPKLFAYLKPRHPESIAVLRAAVACGYRVLAYLPGFSQNLIDDLIRGGRLIASAKPFEFEALPDDIEVGVWHSPTGAIARCLQKGMRMVFLPMHPEQFLASMAVGRNGLPVHVSTGPENWKAVLEMVATWPRPVKNERWLPAVIPEFAEKLSMA